MSDERWLPVVGYEGRYEVSSMGRVKALKARWNSPRVVRASTDKDGYLVVGLGDDSARFRQHFVHRLMLFAFVGPPPAGHISCHRNDEKTDNALSNLRWGTPKENSLDAVLNGSSTKGEKNGNYILDSLAFLSDNLTH